MGISSAKQFIRRHEKAARKFAKNYSYLAIVLWAAAVLVSASHEGLLYYKRQINGQYGSIGRQVDTLPEMSKTRPPTTSVDASVTPDRTDDTTQQSSVADTTSYAQPRTAQVSNRSSARTTPSGPAEAPAQTAGPSSAGPSADAQKSQDNKPQEQPPLACVLGICVGGGLL